MRLDDHYTHVLSLSVMKTIPATSERTKTRTQYPQRHTMHCDRYTQTRAGSFAFGDADYARNQQADGSSGEWGGRGAQALYVLTQVGGRAAGVAAAGGALHMH